MDIYRYIILLGSFALSCGGKPGQEPIVDEGEDGPHSSETGGASVTDDHDSDVAGGASGDPPDDSEVDSGSGGATSTPPGTGGTTSTPPDPAVGDPTCSEGLLNGAGNTCCPASCGSCGGTGCETRPGGAANCCAGAIHESGISCNDASAPCVISSDPPTDPPVDPPGDPGDYSPTGGTCQLVINEEFDGYSGGYETYTEAKMKSDFGATQGPYKGLDGRTKVGESSIRAFFPEGVILGQTTGFTWFSQLPDDIEEAIMTYHVKFEDGFDWTKGGKLPGLCGGTCPRGCTNDVDNGFSMRLMWQRNAGMITYPYWPSQDDEQHCGGSWAWSKNADAGKWHHIRQHIKLNTPGQSNGEIRMYMDGELVQSRNDIRYRNSAGVTIDKAYWTTYVGGSSVEDFAPDHDQYIWFDTFKVWVGCSG